MERQPFFSILVPTYNQAQYLPHALDSIVSQTDGDWEALVVDDGSTDDTQEVLDEYSRRHANIKTFRKENGGVASALNVGLAQARGEWIHWLSSDDLFDPRKLEINRAEIEKHPDTDFFFSYFRLLNEYTGELADHELWGPLPEPEFYVTGLFHRNCICGITICVRREAFEKAGFFDEKLRYAQDYDMWLRLLSVCRGRFIPEYTATSRNHALQGSEIFPQACIYDSAKSGLRLLNKTPFEGLFPGFDLDDEGNSVLSLERILEIAADPSSFIYWLGPHPALLMRAVEWIGRKGRDDEAFREKLEALLQRKASEMKEKDGAGSLGFIWRVTAAAMQLGCAFTYDVVSSKGVGEASYYSMAGEAPERGPLRRYLEQYEGSSIDDVQSLREQGEVVFIAPENIFGREEAGKTAVHKAIRPMALCLAEAGMPVAMVGLGPAEARYIDGIFFVNVPDPRAQTRLLASLAPLDVVVMIGHNEVELSLPRLRAVYDPSTAFLVVERKGLRRPISISKVDGHGLRDAVNRLLGMARAKERESKEKSCVAKFYGYVRRKAGSLLIGR